MDGSPLRRCPLCTCSRPSAGLIVGKSHERLNWLHRWVGRTVLVTASVHGWRFYTDWVRADFVEDQIRMMPMIKYGFGA